MRKRAKSRRKLPLKCTSTSTLRGRHNLIWSRIKSDLDSASSCRIARNLKTGRRKESKRSKSLKTSRRKSAVPWSSLKKSRKNHSSYFRAYWVYVVNGIRSKSPRTPLLKRSRSQRERDHFPRQLISRAILSSYHHWLRIRRVKRKPQSPPWKLSHLNQSWAITS